MQLGKDICYGKPLILTLRAILVLVDGGISELLVKNRYKLAEICVMVSHRSKLDFGNI